jgi:hypothetical protein
MAVDSLANDAIIARLLSFADGLMPDRPLYDYQKEFASSVIRAVVEGTCDDITALFARQSGKTETVARVAAALVVLLPAIAHHKEHPLFCEQSTHLATFQHGMWIGIFAPVREQAATAFARFRDILISEQGQIWLKRFNIQITQNSQTGLMLSNGSSVRIASAMPTANIESRTLHLAIIEEAQDVPSEKIRKSIEPMLSSTAGLLVMLGTANTVRSLFWETIEKNRHRQRQEFNSSNRYHHQFDWTIVVQYNPHYRRFLNAKLLQRGVGWMESDSFKMAYECQFIFERSQLMTMARLEELEALSQEFTRGPYDRHGLCVLRAPLVAGIDWGKAGDSTVVTVIAKYDDFCRVVDWLELQGENYDEQFDCVVQFLRRFPTLDTVLAETNGVGDPMTDRLKKAASAGRLKATIQGFLATESNNSDGYKNLLIDFVYGNRLLLPSDATSSTTTEYQRFIRQVTTVIKEWRGSLIKVRAPDGKHHDDYISSLMMAYWAASKTGSRDMFQDFYQSY